jgi:hypothetical protein
VEKAPFVFSLMMKDKNPDALTPGFHFRDISDCYKEPVSFPNNSFNLRLACWRGQSQAVFALLV